VRLAPGLAKDAAAHGHKFSGATKEAAHFSVARAAAAS